MLSEGRNSFAPLLDLNRAWLDDSVYIRMLDESFTFEIPPSDMNLFFEMWLIENVHGGVDPRTSS
ncbi:MAG: hypothetical protein JNJ45_05555 [Chthonomonas sp.]|nr:hypothetical protein [Chthonomonas sp.]